MLWTTTSELLFEFPIFNRHCAILRGFLFTKSSSFEQQNSHPAESTKPRHSLGFFCWKNSFVAFADFAIRLLVWLLLITHPPSHDWFCPCGVGNPKGGSCWRTISPRYLCFWWLSQFRPIINIFSRSYFLACGCILCIPTVQSMFLGCRYVCSHVLKALNLAGLSRIPSRWSLLEQASEIVFWLI